MASPSPHEGHRGAGGGHDCRMAPTYATVDCENYCGHPSHYGRPPYPDYSEFWGKDICGNCGIPVDSHGDRCGEWAPESARPAVVEGDGR